MLNGAVKERIIALRKQIEALNYAYYVLAAPTLPDQVYDELVKELEQLEKSYPEFYDSHSPTQRVGSDLTLDFAQVAHKEPMLSLLCMRTEIRREFNKPSLSEGAFRTGAYTGRWG